MLFHVRSMIEMGPLRPTAPQRRRGSSDSLAEALCSPQGIPLNTAA